MVSGVSKQSLRKTCHQLRQSLSMPDRIRWSGLICGHIIRFISTRSFDLICGFAPFREEPDIAPVGVHCWQQNLIWALPVVDQVKGRMSFFACDGKTVMAPNRYGIPEPVTASGTVPAVPGSGSLILVPALAVDLAGHRLGYGGGYYDRYLANSGALTLGVVFEKQILKVIPREEHDQRLAGYVTETGIVLRAGNPG